MKNQSEKGYSPLSSILEGTMAETDLRYAMEVLDEAKDNHEIPRDSIQRKGRGIIVNLAYTKTIQEYLASKGIDASKAGIKKKRQKSRELRQTIRNLCIDGQKRLEQRARELEAENREKCARMGLQVTESAIASREDLLSRIEKIDENGVYTVKEVIEKLGLPRSYLSKQSEVLGNMQMNKAGYKLGWLGKNVRAAAITYLDKKFPPASASTS